LGSKTLHQQANSLVQRPIRPERKRGFSRYVMIQALLLLLLLLLLPLLPQL